MSFLLKIVEGPNKGAEIALVEGLCITMGKADSCDIILADPTLPDAPLQVEASADAVSLELPGEGRSHLEPYHVVTVGSTSFAIGMSDTAWPALVWPKKEEPKAEETPAEAPAPAQAEEKAEEKESKEEKKGVGGFLIAIIAFFVLLLLLCLAGWLFREKLSAMLSHGEQDEENAAEVQISPLDALIERYSLEKEESDGAILLKGDFATRAERLAATAEAYAVMPGVELDFADEESLKGAVEETLALVGENELRVEKIEKRVAIFDGKAKNLRRTLEAIAADVPKLANVNCESVEASPDPVAVAAAAAERKARDARNKAPDFPVCGILTSPYPCLVMSNGMRILEGAPFGDGAIVKIEADKVTFTNSTGRVVWKP